MREKSVFKNLNLWCVRPFELLYHAEIHYQNGFDYDKRLSLISFDNSIEVAITTYLTLHPTQRENRTYSKEDVNKWLKNYHSKLDFFFTELASRGLPAHKEKASIVYLHDQRNEQYHGTSAGVPSVNVLNEIRQIAIWIFSILFDISNVEDMLKDAMLESEKTFPEIPVGLVVPEIKEMQQDYEVSLFIAAILGGWNDYSSGDNEIIKEVTSGF